MKELARHCSTSSAQKKQNTGGWWLRLAVGESAIRRPELYQVCRIFLVAVRPKLIVRKGRY
jgi:hypothetical protein